MQHPNQTISNKNQGGEACASLPEVSIIIPIYRAEKWIERCLRSIATQTFTDYEVILIDDASDDNSMQKVEEFLLKNPLNHQLLRQPYQQKQGTARNRGLDIAKGKYTLFVDADDYLPSDDSLAHLYQLIHQSDYDFVIGSYLPANEVPKHTSHRHKKTGKLQGIEIIRTLCLFFVQPAPWSKLIRTSLLKDHHIKFAEKRYFEDTMWSFKLFHQATSIYLSEKPTYYYTNYNTASVTHHLTLDKCRELSLEIREVLRYIAQHSLSNPTTKPLYNRFVNEIIYWALYKLFENSSKEDFFKGYRLFHNTYKKSSFGKSYISCPSPYLSYFTLWMQHRFWQKHIKRVIKYLVRKIIFPIKTKQ